MCGNEIVASQVDSHSKLCLERIQTKEKASKIDNRFMEINSMITNEISELTKKKVSSAVISKRTLLNEKGGNSNPLTINSPLITN